MPLNYLTLFGEIVKISPFCFLSKKRKYIRNSNTLQYSIKELASVKNLIRSFKEGIKMKLSKRELEILELISCGYSDKEIAGNLNISARTVQTHVTRIVIKLGARNRTNAVANYIRQSCLMNFA